MKGVITNIDESKAKSVPILSDFCSQSSSCSYISEKVVKTLSLKPVDGGNITIKTLGNENSDENLFTNTNLRLKH